MYDEREFTVEQIAKVLGGSRTSIYRGLGAGPAPAPEVSPVAGSSAPILSVQPGVTPGPAKILSIFGQDGQRSQLR